MPSFGQTLRVSLQPQVVRRQPQGMPAQMTTLLCGEAASWTVLLIRCARLMVSADLVQRNPAADSTDESYITTQRG